MSKIKFMVDSTSDIPKEIAEKYNVSVLPLSIIFKEKTYLDWIDISGKEFYDKLQESKDPVTTSQPSASMIADEMKSAFADGYDEIILFTISSKGSGTFNSANIAKQSMLEDNPDAKIHIVDTLTYSYFITVTLLYAIQLYEAGKGAEEIISQSKSYLENWDVVFLVDTLTYLQRGGRINTATLILGKMLNIKPVLSVRNGIIDTIDKFRGNKNILDKLFEKAVEFDNESPVFAIAHADAQEKASDLLSIIRRQTNQPNVEPLVFGMLGSVIGAHVGPGTVALFFNKKR